MKLEYENYGFPKYDMGFFFFFKGIGRGRCSGSDCVSSAEFRHVVTLPFSHLNWLQEDARDF